MPTVVELQSSRQYSHNRGKPSATRDFLVLDAANESDVLSLFGSTLPQQYDDYPNTGAFVYRLVARDYSITKVDEHPQAFRISYIYEPVGNVVPDTENPFTIDKDPGEVGYRTAQFGTKVRTELRWRQMGWVDGLAYANSGTANLLNSPIDEHGTPMELDVYMQELTITIVDQALPSSSNIGRQLNTRNASPFLGYEQGIVLFTGFDGSIQPETGNTQCSFKFLASQTAHLIQSPKRTSLGTVVTSITAGIWYGKADPVALVQPYPVTTDFSTLSPHFQGL